MSSQQVLTIKERLPIADVVSSYIRLERAGNYFRARCPFHNEKTPSFYVSPARGTFRCFGCGKGGDVVTFVEDIEGLTFKEALARLADRAGVELVYEKKTSEDYLKMRLQALHEKAVLWYKDNLLKHPDALKYLHERGLTDETIANFSIGLSLEGWDGLTAHLKEDGATDADLVASGLALMGNRGPYDRFRSRIMFPIRDSVGKTVAFTGRVLPWETNEKEGKYVNSPETPIYSKSNILFGYDMAKRSFLKDNRAIIVEGQMDLIMAHQAGTTSAVAVSGTALTEAHLALLKRFTDNIVFSFDADGAGVKASERSVELALSLGMNVEMLLIPEGKDPADVIRDDPSAWKKITENTRHIVEYLLSVYTRPSIPERERVRDVTRHVLPAVASIPNAVEEALFIKKIATALGLPESSIQTEVEKIREGNRKGIREETTVPDEKDAKRRYQMLEDELITILALSPRPEGSEKILKEYERIREKPYEEIWESLAPDRKEMILFAAEVRYLKEPPTPAFLRDILFEFERSFLEEKLRRISLLLKKSEKEGREEKIKEYLTKSRDVLQALETLKTRSHS